MGKRVSLNHRPRLPPSERCPPKGRPRTRAVSGKGRRDLLRAVAIFGLATVALTYPLSFHPSNRGPFGDPIAEANAWTLSWVAHQVTSQPLRLFEANRFYPLPQALAYSEHLFVPGLLATPLLRLTDDLVLTHNLVLLSAIFASALGMYLLVMLLTGNGSAAILAGLFFSFAPLRFEWLGELQIQLYAFLPVSLACLHLFFKTGARRWAWGFAAFWLLQSLSGNYLAVMATVAGAIALGVELTGTSRPWRDLTRLPLALACAAPVAYLFALPYIQVHSTMPPEPNRSEIAFQSAGPMAYLASSSTLYSPLSDYLVDEADRTGTDNLFPGLTLLLLAATGSVVLLLRKGGFSRPRGTLAWCWLTLVTGLVFTLGPRTPVYRLLSERVFFFFDLTAPSRFALLSLFSLSVLSGFALAWLLPGLRRSKTWAMAAIAAFFILESMPSTHGLSALQDQPPQVYPWLARQAEPGAIVELPYRLAEQSYLFWARHHGFRPTLNGTARQIPTAHQWIERALADFPSNDSVRLLQRLEVRYVILHLGSYEPRALLRLLNALTQYRRDILPLRDFGEILVFEVMALQRPSSAPNEPMRTLAARPGNDPNSALSRFTEVEFEFDEPQSVSGVRIHYGPHPRIVAAGVELWVPDAEGTWALAWQSPTEWPALTDLVLELIENPRNGTQNLYFGPLRSGAYRVRLAGFEAPPDVTEIELLGARDPS